MKNKNRIVAIIVSVVILLLLIIPKIDFTSNNEKVSNSSNAKSNKVMVAAKIMKAEPLKKKIFTNGTLIGNEEIELRSETSGKVTEILFKEGKKVKKGSILLKINDAELQATLKKNLLREELAEDKEFRARQMLEKQLTSQQEYDVVLNDLGTIKADIEYINAQIAKTEIRAPFDGIVGLRSVSIGSYITPQVPVATFQSINPIKIDFAVPQKYFNEVKEGREIEFELPNNDKIFTGKIYAVEPKIDLATRTIQVRAIAPNNDGLLSPGAYVEIDIVLANVKNALMIPSDALVPDIKGEKVYLYKNGKAVSQIVKTGIRDEANIQITSGILPGDTVIVSGIIQLRENTPVSLKEIK